MQELDFDAYRRCYYWFQLHFFLRGEQQGKSGLLPDFLNSLILSEDEVHRRWEVKERCTTKPETPLKRTPRGMKKADAIKAEEIRQGAFPVKSFNNVHLCKYASKKSIRCRYMLFDWLRCKNGRIWNCFASLYRTLIVFDLMKKHNMNSTQIIAEARLFDEKLLHEVRDERGLLNYEAAIIEIMGKGIFKTILDPISFSDKSMFLYIGTTDNRLLEKSIKTHYKRADELIHLAKSGNFNDLSKLPPLKH